MAWKMLKPATIFVVAIALVVILWSQYDGGAGASKRRTSGVRDGLQHSLYGNKCNVSPKKLAIFQGKWWHTEVFGFIIEFSRRCGHELVIYHSANHATSALPLYQKLYAPLAVRPSEKFREEHQQYDAIFLSTPDDDLDEYFRKDNAHRMIYCAHMTHPKFLHRWHVLRLHMTPLAGWPYVIQAYAAQEPIPAEKRTKEIIMVGTVFDGENYKVEDIYQYARLVGEKGWKFVAFTRHWKSDVDKPENLELVEGSSTEDMYNRIRQASYVLIFPSERSWYHTDRITGALPLAISCGTPIVTTQHLGQIYGLGLPSGVIAAAGAEALATSTTAVSASQYSTLVAAITQFRSRLIANNIAVIEMVMGGIPAVAAASLAEAANGRGSNALLPAPSGAGSAGSSDVGLASMTVNAMGMLPLSYEFPRRIPPNIGCND